MPSNQKSGTSARLPRRALLSALGLIVAGASLGCGDDPLPGITHVIRARELTADVRVALSQAADASNRAVMAESEPTAREAGAEAERLRAEVRADLATLDELLDGPGYRDEQRQIDTFEEHFAAYEATDETLIALATQKSNLMARQISYGSANDAVEAFRAALDHASMGGGKRWQLEAWRARAMLAVRELQVLEAPHIAESSDAEMTRLEQQMSAREAEARASLQALAVAGIDTTEAAHHLDAFLSLHTKILDLSRQNTDVRSLALSLGELRVATVACDGALAALLELLSTRGTWPTK